MTQQERKKRYQERHKRQGLCVSCSRKAQKERTFCSVCLEKMRERWMKRHPIICGECGKIVTLKERRERDGIRFHRACAEKRAKGYQERHRKLGLCVQCSRKPAPGFVSCRVCLEREREMRMGRRPLFCGECKKLVKPEDRNGRKFHKLCAEKRQSRWYPQIHRSAAIAYQQRHRMLGLCTSCPRKAFKGGLCRRHYGMVLERYYERAAG